MSVVEDAVAREDLLEALSTSEPTLSVSDSSIVVPHGGSSNITVSDSRGGDAEGLVVKLRWKGIMPVSAMQLTLGPDGSASVVFGPCPSGQCSSSPERVEFYYEDDSATPSSTRVQFN